MALPNPRFAPYGKAARQYLEDAGLQDRLGDRLVFTENASQVIHFVRLQGADIGLTAAVAVRCLPNRIPGYAVAVPPSEYAPVRHAAVMTSAAPRRGREKLAHAFLKWLGGRGAGRILFQCGMAPADLNRPDVEDK